jgi:hypothetical protein
MAGSRGRIRTFGRGSKVPCLTAWLLGIAWLPIVRNARPVVRCGDPTLRERGRIADQARDLRRSGSVLYVVRIALLVGLLIATAACGSYRFPGPAHETGTVHGQVTSSSCAGPCPATLVPCPPQPATPACGQRPMVGLGLVFTKGNTSFVAKTDSDGAYSINLPVGTWSVTAATVARIISGPQTLEVQPGTTIVADFIVDTGIRAAA